MDWPKSRFWQLNPVAVNSATSTRFLTRAALPIASMLIASACTHHVGDPESAHPHTIEHRFGYTRIVSHTDFQGVKSTKARTLGAWLGSNNIQSERISGLGWHSTESLALPQKCQVIFVIKSDASIAQAIEILRAVNFQEDSICVVEPD